MSKSIYFKGKMLQRLVKLNKELILFKRLKRTIYLFKVQLMN